MSTVTFGTVTLCKAKVDNSGDSSREYDINADVMARNESEGMIGQEGSVANGQVKKDGTLVATFSSYLQTGLNLVLLVEDEREAITTAVSSFVSVARSAASKATITIA